MHQNLSKEGFFLFFFQDLWLQYIQEELGPLGQPENCGKIDPLESYEISGGRGCGKVHLKVHSTSDWTLVSPLSLTLHIKFTTQLGQKVHLVHLVPGVEVVNKFT